MGQTLTCVPRNQSRQNEQEEQLIERDQQVTNLQGQLTVGNELITDLDEALRNEEVTYLQGQLTLSYEQITDLIEQLTASNKQIADLEEELTARVEEAAYLHGQLAVSNEQITDLQGQLTASNEQISDLEEELTARNEDVTYLQGQLAASNEREGSLSNENRPETQQDWDLNRNEVMVTGEVLGQGAWGRVLRGRFRRCNVAVKQIYEAILSPHNRTTFEREVGIASRCRHPCLLQFIGATNDDEGLQLVTELMDRSLRSLYDERPLKEREISVISLDLAQALNYLHQNKPDPIIHRDISSANVLLWRKGGDWRAKVSDYGTANFVRQCRIDNSGAAIYCAPEAIAGARDQIMSCKVSLDKAVDLKR